MLESAGLESIAIRETELSGVQWDINLNSHHKALGSVINSTEDLGKFGHGKKASRHRTGLRRSTNINAWNCRWVRGCWT
jgi:hypothetical protein